MRKPAIAVVGRPNVGKSMLFNRIVEKRHAIVEDTPGVTRDRLFAEGEWRARRFDVIDTGGIEPQTDDEMLKHMKAQAMLAIDYADVIVLVADVRTGVTAADADVATLLKKSKKPVVLCVNKVDTPGGPPPELYEFYALGLGDPYGVSALHGQGVGDLLDACFEQFPQEDELPNEDSDVKVALIGKPNAGKSSLLNCLTGEPRAIVSAVPGTTRDTIDSLITRGDDRFLFIDTAGIRKRPKIEQGIEKYAVIRAQMAIDRADVCVLLIDAQDGVTEQDTKIAGLAHEGGKGVIIAVNKWDLIEKETNTQAEYEKGIRAALSYMTYAPVVFISAMTGYKVESLFALVRTVAANNAMRITTGTLNGILADATVRVQPPTDKGRRLKVYYMTQVASKPPTFVCFCNDVKLFHYSYVRYLENQIRSVYALTGTPIRMIVRQRSGREE